MTFKHGKFQDSAVMRSLEKVAREKGLVKNEELVKSASQTKKTDLFPGSSLLVNLLTLSAGLREAGFDKYADELEQKTVALKSAQTLYEAHKETGEDLVDAAHPKGSHKLEGVDGGELAVIETIVDQHLANLKMIEKKPTGKLASTRDVLAAVRVVLGQSAVETQKAKYKEITGLLTPMLNVLTSVKDEGDFRVRLSLLMMVPNTLGRKINVGVPVGPEDVNKFQGAISTVTSQLMFVDPNSQKFKEDKAAMFPNKLNWRLQDYDAWVKLEEMLKQWRTLGQQMAGIAAGGLDEFSQKILKQEARLAGMRSLLKDEGFTQADKTQGEQWIKYFEGSLRNWKSVLAGITDPDQKAEVAKRYEGKLADLTNKINQFQAQMNGQAQT